MTLTLTLILASLAFSFCSAEVRSRHASGGAVAKREVKAKAQDAGTIKPAPQPAFNLQKEQGYKHAPAAAPVVEKPAKLIRDEYAEKSAEPKPKPKTKGKAGSDRVILHGAIGEKGQPNAVIVEDGTEAAAVSAESHNRDQGGKPADSKAKGKGKTED
ncbi:MAG: hypothetical protein WC728_01240 [Elusimicrobiota bacterium]